MKDKNSMNVIKRNGNFEQVSFDKVLNRIVKLTGGENGDKRFEFLPAIDVYDLSLKIINNLHDNIKTTDLDIYASEYCIDLSIREPQYLTLASRIITSNYHKSYSAKNFSDSINFLHSKNLINECVYEITNKYKDRINAEIDTFRDYSVDYFGYKTLEKSYLYKVNVNGREYMETPQFMFMRVSLGLWKDNLEKAFKTYHNMSKLNFVHATPTLFNSGTIREQNSSCFLMGTDDSLEGIMKTISDTAFISKWAGGIGIHVSNIRSKGSIIRKTNGKSLGIIPMLKVYNELTSYINQGGKRNGSVAIYLEPHHPDIIDFLKIKNNITDINLACKNLFTALWASDYFMECVEKDADWYLMCPDTCPGLTDTFSDGYKKLYNYYVDKKMYKKKIKAREIWSALLKSQSVSGVPYLLYKDACNEKSNQKNIGVIKSSNLCTEITLVSDNENYSVCNLASICLSKFIKNGDLDVEKLMSITSQIVENLNKVIDVNYYPLEEAKKTNLLNRPIGIGVQGLANFFYLLKVPFESEKAKELNKKIFETIQYTAIKKSCELAKKDGHYDRFEGSPSSKGIFQHNMWGIENKDCIYDWDSLKDDVIKYGLRNSVLTTLMPTASTSQIMGNFESFEPITSNMFIRNTLSGNHVVINKHLVKDLSDLKLWSFEMSKKIQETGSIQHIKEIPKDIKDLYKTVWEIKQKVLIDLAADRGPFIDQSQSMNLYMCDLTENKLSSMHFYTWKKGLKTGIYYLRQKPSSEAIKFTIDCEGCGA